MKKLQIKAIKEFKEMLEFRVKQCELLLEKGDDCEFDFGDIVIGTSEDCEDFN